LGVGGKKKEKNGLRGKLVEDRDGGRYKRRRYYRHNTLGMIPKGEKVTIAMEGGKGQSKGCPVRQKKIVNNAITLGYATNNPPAGKEDPFGPTQVHKKKRSSGVLPAG